MNDERKKDGTIMNTAIHAADADYRRDLGDGLVLRWSKAEDIEKIAYLMGQAFRQTEDEPHNEGTVDEIRMLMSGHISSLMNVGDYAIVEDTGKEGSPIVAGASFQHQVWYYEDIPFKIVRPEGVASLPDYRNKGLIRATIELVHARSEAEGYFVRTINGIPYFYRQFGYEYAVATHGRRVVALSEIAELKEGEQEPFTVREATLEDLPIVQELYEQWRARYALSLKLPEDYLRYIIEGWRTAPIRQRNSIIRVVQDQQQNVVGWFNGYHKRWGEGVVIDVFCPARGINLQALAPSLLRAIRAYGREMPVAPNVKEPFSNIMFRLGSQHALYDVLNEAQKPLAVPYALYFSVVDLPRFIMQIAPVLERRLLDSPVTGYSGEFKLNMYRSGLRLVFEQGKLTVAEPWRAPIYDDNSDGGMPQHAFLQALTGYHSLAELRHTYPDAWVNSTALFNTLFPKKDSWVFLI